MGFIFVPEKSAKNEKSQKIFNFCVISPGGVGLHRGDRDCGNLQENAGKKCQKRKFHQLSKIRKMTKLEAEEIFNRM
jgi:hypothetical protein